MLIYMGPSSGFFWDADTLREVVLPLTSSDQLSQQVTPLCPELVGACQTAVTSNHAQVGDS